MVSIPVFQDQNLTHEIIGTAIEVHRHLGPGLLESAYQWCLEVEFKEKGWIYQRERIVPFFSSKAGYTRDLLNIIDA
jgi:GxxExxY protein